MAEPRRVRPARAGLVITLSLLAAVLVLTGSLLLARAQQPATEFAGTDAQATEQLEAGGYTPWFSPLLHLGSAELESGLFATQAALGAGVLGFVLGTLRERRRQRARAASAAGASDHPGQR